MAFFQTPFFFTIYFLFIVIFQRFLLESCIRTRNFLLDDQDDELNTPLHLACMHQREDIVKLLLENGANVNSKNIQHFTPLDISCAKSNTRIFELLIEYKSPINMQRDGVRYDLPIHLVCRNGNAYMLKCLLAYGADPTLPNKKNQTALDIALKKNHAELIEILLNLPEWPNLVGLTYVDKQKNSNSRFKQLNKNNPELTKIVLDKLIISKDTRKYDFKPLDPSFDHIEKINDHPLFVLAQTEREDLLNHEVVKFLLDIKWKNMPRIFYFTNLLTYAIFLFLLTYHLLMAKKIVKIESLSSFNRTVFVDVNASTNATSFFKHPTKFLSDMSLLLLTLNFILLILHLGKECIQIWQHNIRYFYALDNNLELFTYVLSLIFLTPPSNELSHSYISHQGENVLFLKNDFQWGVGSVCGLTGWIVLALFFQKIGKYGIFAIMFRKVKFNLVVVCFLNIVISFCWLKNVFITKKLIIKFLKKKLFFF